MARLSKEEEAKRNRQVITMIEKGMNHIQIAEQLGMRPQNVRGLKVWKMMHGELDGEFEIVSARDQRVVLDDTTEKIWEDLGEIEVLIALYKQSPERNRESIIKLYRLKKEYYKELGVMWAIPDTISGNTTGPGTVKGEKVQINYNKVDYQRLNEAAKEAIRELDEARDG